MNNEEKIIAMLEGMTARMDRMEDNTNSRFDRLESDMAKMQAQITQVAMFQENRVMKAIDALAEGQELTHEMLRELDAKRRLELLENDNAVMKAAIKALARDVAELKQAQ